ncbi:MAG: DNA polymerase III subunit delta [Rhodospirillales bacterium]
MKIAPRQVESFLARPDSGVHAVLIYGPDQGLARERAERLIASVIKDTNDPFLLTTLAGAALRQDPALLSDEAAALSFSQERRVIRVRDATDGLAKIFSDFLDDPKGDSFIIVEAGELGPRSTLRKTFEQADAAAALACYADDNRQLAHVIEETLGRYKIRVSREAMAYLLERLGADRMITRGELEKLALYMNEGTTVGLEDARACIDDSAAVSLDAVVYAACSGDHAALDVELRRVYAEGTHPVQILRALARHLQRLQLANALVRGGQTVDQAMKAMRPPILFMFADRFRYQVSLWPAGRLADAVDIVLEAEMQCKTTGVPAEALCGRTLMRITQGAHAMARRSA